MTVVPNTFLITVGTTFLVIVPILHSFVLMPTTAIRERKISEEIYFQRRQYFPSSLSLVKFRIESSPYRLNASLMTKCRSSSDAVSATSSPPTSLSLVLEKPLGLILEEVEENSSRGVLVGEVDPSGSAGSSGYAKSLVGKRIRSVAGTDVTKMIFDDVMTNIIEAESPLEIVFDVGEVETSTDEAQEEDSTEENAMSSMYEPGTKVDLVVRQNGNNPITISAAVGDNLRTTLLENNVELYRGLKKKLGNCGGGGQCTFCAVNFEEEDEAWGVRSEYEDNRLKKGPKSVRLACLNNIMGPATIQIE